MDYFTRMQAQAKSAFWTDMTFDINPLTRIYQLPENDYIRPAANEVIVLEPCWEGNIPFDISKLISLEDFTDAFSHMKCKCCGCNGDEQLKWVSSIFVEKYHVRQQAEAQGAFSPCTNSTAERISLLYCRICTVRFILILLTTLCFKMFLFMVLRTLDEYSVLLFLLLKPFNH